MTTLFSADVTVGALPALTVKAGGATILSAVFPPPTVPPATSPQVALTLPVPLPEELPVRLEIKVDHAPSVELVLSDRAAGAPLVPWQVAPSPNSEFDVARLVKLVAVPLLHASVKEAFDAPIAEGVTLGDVFRWAEVVTDTGPRRRRGAGEARVVATPLRVAAGLVEARKSSFVAGPVKVTVRGRPAGADTFYGVDLEPTTAAPARGPLRAPGAASRRGGRSTRPATPRP